MKHRGLETVVRAIVMVQCLGCGLLAQTDILLVPDGIKVIAVTPDGNFLGNPASLSYSVSGSVLTYSLNTVNSDNVPIVATGTWEMLVPPSAKGFDLNTEINFAPPVTVQFKIFYNDVLRIQRGAIYSPYGLCLSRDTNNFFGTITCDDVRHLEVESTPSVRRAYLETYVHVARGAQPGQSLTVRVYYRLPPAAPTCPASAQASDHGGIAPKIAVACKNSIEMALSLPFASTNPIAAIADELPAFCASGTYSLTTGRQARIVLVLRDDQNRTLAQSDQFYRFDPDDKKPWGGGCVDRSSLVVIREKKIEQLRTEKLWPPKFDLADIARVSSDDVLGKLFLSAVLLDFTTNGIIAESTPVAYDVIVGAKVISSRLKLTKKGTSSPADEFTLPSDIVLSNRSGPESSTLFEAAAKEQVGYSGIALELEVDFPAEEGDLTAVFQGNDNLGKPLAFKLSSTREPIKKGKNKVSLKLTGTLPPRASSLAIIPQVEIRYTQKILLPAILLPVNVIYIAGIKPDDTLCSLNTEESKANCLQPGKDTLIEANIVVSPAQPVLYVNTTITTNEFDNFKLSKVPGTENPPVGRNSTFPHSTLVRPNFASASADPRFVTKSYNLTYELFCPTFSICGEAKEVFRNFATLGVPVGSAATGTSAGQLPDMALQGIKAPTSTMEDVVRKVAAVVVLKKIDSLILAPQLQSRANPIGPRVDFVQGKELFSRAEASVADPDLILLRNEWQINPPRPRGGSFAATIALRYGDNQLPDDPNFNEEKLQVVSLDPAGALHVYPTLLNVVTKEATAQIDSLDPLYALAVVGPFQHMPVMMASAPSGYAVVNAGPLPANLRLTNPSNDGVGTGAIATLNSMNMIRAASEGWLKGWADSTSVAGASWQEVGRQLAVAPAGKPGLAFLLPSVEYASRLTTEIYLANPGVEDAEVTINLLKPDGTKQGSFATKVTQSTANSLVIHNIFPGLATGFQGYAFLTSTRPIVAGGMRRTAGGMASLVAQPVDAASVATTTRYAPVMGDANIAATLHVVNAGALPATVTLRGRAANGSAATDVTVKLAPGQQYTRDLTDGFGVVPIASMTVISNTPGVFGDLLSSDSAFLSQYSASLPLTGEPSLNAVLPYTPTTTVVPVFNFGTTSATITVTAYSPTGAAGPASTTNVAPGARALINAQSNNGYVIVRSTQPVVAAGLITSTGGGIAGYPAIGVGATGSGTGGTGPVPAATAAGVLHAASFRGGAVAPGEIVTIFGSNIGPATLATLKLDAQGKVATDLNTARVLFDGVPAPMIYTLSGQNSVIVPYSVAGRGSTQVVVEYQGRQSPPVSLAVAAAAPGLFSANSSGTGPGAILNQNGSLNTPSNPAAVGSIVVLYGTGEGQTTPSGIDGSVASAVFPKPVLPVSISIGGRDARVLYAGAAPNLVAGVLQVNVEVPAGLAGGNQPVLLTVGSISSQPGLTVAIAGGQTQAPVIAVTPASLDFGNVSVGQTKDLTLTVRNNGTAILTVAQLGSSNPRFSSAQSTPFTVIPGSSQNIVIRFSPAAAGTQTGVITLVSNDPASSNRAISVTGIGTATTTAPSIEVNASVIDFGTVNTGQTRDLPILVRNAGSAALIISTISGSNPRFAPFGITLPLTLAAGASQALTIRFSPIAAGQQTATMTITSNDPARPAATVNVTGNGSGAGGGVLPVITFGQTINGTLSTSTPGRSVNCPTCYADTYQLTVTAARNIVITLNSTAFDSFLQLMDENRNVLSTNDDGGGGLNARITGTIQPGVYRIEVTTANDFETGAYALAVAP